MAMTTFTLPETRAALARWREITGLTEDSPEWGEVQRVLDDTGLLRADGEQQLFDDPAMPPGEAAGVIALRLAIVGGAVFHRQMIERVSFEKHGLATCTAVVAALLASFYDMTGLTFAQALYLLETELPTRVHGIAVHPAVALRWRAEHPLPLTAVGTSSLAAEILRAAFDDDEFAVRVFARTADDPAYHLALTALCTGNWVVYDSASRV
jgi:hypothetical protein